MPRTAAPLPTSLASRPFSVPEAARAGVSAGRVRRRDLVRPTWGARDVEPASGLLRRAHQFGVALPTPWAFSFVTAARLRGAPLRRDWTPDEQLDVTRPTGTTQVRRDGVRGHRGLEVRDVSEVDGLPVTSPLWTWLDLASVRGVTPTDLVVVGDAFAAADPALLPAMMAAVDAGAVRRGIRALREAAPLVRSRSASPGETRARLAFAETALPEPELNVDVFDAHGSFVARVDFLWRSAKVVVEYEGDHHRTDRVQWMRDIERVRDLEALGYTVIRITSRDLTDLRARSTLLRRLHDLVDPR